MKQILIKIFKITLILAAIILLCLLIAGVVLLLDWPWWTGLFMLLGVTGIWLGLLFFRKILLRRREQHFVQQIISRDQAGTDRVSGRRKDHYRELREKWKEAIETLKKSHLKQTGNPLYVLPWYMILGESGTGKTTALKSARLSSPFADTNRVAGISGTRNCDWWFFEQAIILDTAGRYAVQMESEENRQEWQKFLALLGKFRKKEPINGLIVTVAADKLLQSSRESIAKDGREIRDRLNEMMRALGVKFPVYLMVTKCDLIKGMTDFCDRLPDAVLDQAMGVIREDESLTVDGFAAYAIEKTCSQLRRTRLMLLHQSVGRDSRSRSGLLLFPEEFARLEPNLKVFIKAAFEDNPYQETPLLRGLYFSSGKQEGTPYSHFLHSLGLIDRQEVLPGTSKSLFLHDFFARILPEERSLLAPTRKNREWQILTRNLGLAAWLITGLALCGLLSFSFVKNLHSLRQVSREFSSPPAVTGETLSDLMTLDRFRNTLVKIEDQNRHWWIPRFGLSESLQVEKRLKNKYCQWFKQVILQPSDQKIAVDMASFSNQTPGNVLAAYLPHLIRRINLVQARISDKSLENLAETPLPGPPPGLVQATDIPPEEIEKRYNGLILSYVAWNENLDEMTKDTAVLKTWLKHLLADGRINLRWIVIWINHTGKIEPVTLARFWGGSASGKDEIVVSPAFTSRGHSALNGLLDELDKAIDDPLLTARSRKDLETWYRKAYLDNWLAFAAHFSDGAYRLKTGDEWRQAAILMIRNQNPYFSLLDTMAAELQVISAQPQLATWVSTVFEINTVRKMASQPGALGKAQGTLSRITGKGKKFLQAVKLDDTGPNNSAVLKKRLQAAGAYRDYLASLMKMEPILTSRTSSYNTAAAIFLGREEEQNNLLAALKSALQVKALLGNVRTPSTDVVWQLLQGPADFCWSYICTEAACHLQEIWNQEILAEMQGSMEWARVKNILLGEQGKIWGFVKGPAQPFIDWYPGKGYFAKNVMGSQLPFTADFFIFLNQAAAGRASMKECYDVIITGLPTDVNPDARIKPYDTRLELQCSGGSQKIINMNYPVSKHFKWSPDSCGDVIFKINMGNFILSKTYSGYEGFPRFLQDFRDGQHTFYPRDFPEKQAALERLGIKFIRAQYRFKGNGAVLRLLQGTPEKIPREIVSCCD